jgi:hypothetical protein
MGGDTAWDTLIGWFYSSCVMNEQERVWYSQG